MEKIDFNKTLEELQFSTGGGLDAFQKYVDKKIIPNGKTTYKLSALREERTGSIVFYENGKVTYCDFGNLNETGDILDLYGKIHNTDNKLEQLKYACSDNGVSLIYEEVNNKFFERFRIYDSNPNVKIVDAALIEFCQDGYTKQYVPYGNPKYKDEAGKPKHKLWTAWHNKSKSRVTIVEGVKDAYTGGEWAERVNKNISVIGIDSTGVTPQDIDIEKIKEYFSEVIVMLDNDEAGHKAASKFEEYCPVIYQEEENDFSDLIVKNSDEELYNKIQFWLDEAKLEKYQGEFADEVLDDLPPMFDNILETFEDKKIKKLFLLVLVTTLSRLTPNIYYINDGDKTAINMYSYILGHTGSGKGMAKYAKYLLVKFKETLKARYANDMDTYKLEKAEYNAINAKAKKAINDFNKGAEVELIPEPTEPTKPSMQKATFAMNTSYRAMINNLNASGGRGFILETEGENLKMSLGSDWGNIVGLLLKGFEGEDEEVDRAEGTISVDNVTLSIVITSTAYQFFEVISNASDGFLPRFAFYILPENRGIEDKSGETETFHSEHIASYSKAINDIYLYYEQGSHDKVIRKHKDLLSKGQTPGFECPKFDEYYIKIPKQLRMEAIDFFNRKQSQYASSDKVADAITRQMGILHRIAGVLTVFRLGNKLKANDYTEVSEADFRTAFTMCKTFTNNLWKVAQQLGKFHDSVKSSDKEQSARDTHITPEKRRKQVIEMEKEGNSRDFIAKHFCCSKKTIQRDLNKNK